MKRRDDGSMSVVMVGVLTVAVAAALAAGRVGLAAVARARADTAADAAALAAADMLALGRGPTVASNAARATAHANGAELVRCSCRGRIVTVRVRVVIAGMADAHADARAEIDANFGPARNVRDRAVDQPVWTIPSSRKSANSP